MIYVRIFLLCEAEGSLWDHSPICSPAVGLIMYQESKQGRRDVLSLFTGRRTLWMGRSACMGRVHRPQSPPCTSVA